MPAPLSATVRRISSAVASAESVTRPPAAVWRTPFSTKLKSICPNWVTSPCKGGKSGETAVVNTTPCACASGSARATTSAMSGATATGATCSHFCPASSAATWPRLWTRLSRWVVSVCMAEKACSAVRLSAILPVRNPSKYPCKVVSGVRKSCETFSTKSRRICSICCRPAAMWLKARPSMPTSAGPSSSTRTAYWPRAMSAAARLIWRMG